MMKLIRCAATLFVIAVVGCSPDAPLSEPGQASSGWKLGTFDVLVFAPHSDDEAIGCTGVMLQAMERKQRVGVVVITAGDGFDRAAAAVAGKDIDKLVPEDFLKLAALRQRHSLRGMARIGVPAENLIFLGYPDGGLDRIYQKEGTTPFRQRFTHKRETYGSVVRDYHSLAHGKPAPYTKGAVIADIAEIIQRCQPQEIYVTNDADSHGDHRAAGWFVRDAAKAAGYRGTLFTYVVHGRPPPESPGRRVSLSKTELATKRAVIELYQEGTSPVHDELAATYALPEELFWPVQIGGGAK
ncbi:PIG-L family deacetylase [Prosthecobacter sp.]|uniref:PIG-L deacetylase family protein n=1 Tax=Prosthecobacter sp. TaxID=1965333 RepID=UPI002AB8EB55|nr:PIG-L family deacetylase [Prosthecobacter sp.]MDZ4401717.1 PIG-L family deacetylase [Prosthecobacter sp.]